MPTCFKSRDSLKTTPSLQKPLKKPADFPMACHLLLFPLQNIKSIERKLWFLNEQIIQYVKKDDSDMDYD